LGFLNRIGARVVAQAVQLGDTPHLEQLIGPVKVLLDAYQNGDVDEVHIFYTRFVNSMTQVPVSEQLVPLTSEQLRPQVTTHSWEYIYEPDPQTVIDELLSRYVESMIYRAVAENMASEQSARRMAMKSASDNAGNVIGELNLIYNKNRQAAITKEISEIVSGAAAV
jgi:F-type H+-transporting ATPase subunit gamma